MLICFVKTKHQFGKFYFHRKKMYKHGFKHLVSSVAPVGSPQIAESGSATRPCRRLSSLLLCRAPLMESTLLFAALQLLGHI